MERRVEFKSVRSRACFLHEARALERSLRHSTRCKPLKSGGGSARGTRGAQLDVYPFPNLPTPRVSRAFMLESHFLTLNT